MDWLNPNNGHEYCEYGYSSDCDADVCEGVAVREGLGREEHASEYSSHVTTGAYYAGDKPY